MVQVRKNHDTAAVATTTTGSGRGGGGGIFQSCVLATTVMMNSTAWLMMFAAVAVLMTLIAIFGPTQYMLDQEHALNHQHGFLKEHVVGAGAVPEQQQQQQQHQQQKQLPQVVAVDDLAHETRFQEITLKKKCLPFENPKCKTFVPDPKPTTTSGAGGEARTKTKKKVQRVGLIAPPGDLSSTLLVRMEQIMLHHNRKLQKNHHHHHGDDNQDDEKHIDTLEMEVIETTHVPPYGYGKSHGWTKLVRLVPQPLALQVTDALLGVLRPGETMDHITLDDVKVALRQIVRFHCRISHLSAHTALLSVPFMDLISDPANVTTTLRQFLIPHDSELQVDNQDQQQQQQQKRDGVPPKEAEEGEEDPLDVMNGLDDDEAMMFAMDDDQGGLFDAQEAYGTQLFTDLQRKHQIDIQATLDAILVDEMELSKDMSVWPCPSFWDTTTLFADNHHNTDTTSLRQKTLSVFTQRLAKALSPDCSENNWYATCWVERDLCESQGNPDCPKQKQ